MRQRELSRNVEDNERYDDSVVQIEDYLDYIDKQRAGTSAMAIRSRLKNKNPAEKDMK